MTNDAIGNSKAQASSDTDIAPTPARVLASLGEPGKGPSVVITAAIHGNEPAGVIAVQRVVSQLKSDLSHDKKNKSLLGGSIFSTIGNYSAFKQNRRYLHQDLNRLWQSERFQNNRWLNNGNPEDFEQHELWQLLQPKLQESPDVFFIDLHTASAKTTPFALIANTPNNRHFARSLPIPLTFGLVESLSGLLMDYVESRGASAIGLEGGQHQDSRAVENLEACLWLLLHQAGLNIDTSKVNRAKQHLQQTEKDLPRAVKVSYRHAVHPSDNFHMVPGFENFEPVRNGQLLAHDRNGIVVSPHAGRILLPLYQGTGTEGFFICQNTS